MEEAEDRDIDLNVLWCSYLQYLSVIMLGFIVTRSVLVPTSAVYFSLMGGMLHLQRRKQSQWSSVVPGVTYFRLGMLRKLIVELHNYHTVVGLLQ